MASLSRTGTRRWRVPGLLLQIAGALAAVARSRSCSPPSSSPASTATPCSSSCCARTRWRRAPPPIRSTPTCRCGARSPPRWRPIHAWRRRPRARRRPCSPIRSPAGPPPASRASRSMTRKAARGPRPDARRRRRHGGAARPRPDPSATVESHAGRVWVVVPVPLSGARGSLAVAASAAPLLHALAPEELGRKRAWCCSTAPGASCSAATTRPGRCRCRWSKPRSPAACRAPAATTSSAAPSWWAPGRGRTRAAGWCSRPSPPPSPRPPRAAWRAAPRSPSASRSRSPR